MAKLRVTLDTENINTFYKVMDQFVDELIKSGNDDSITGLEDWIEDKGREITSRLADLTENKKMNLGKKYKQLFEGKTRSNDSKLLKENVNPESDEDFIARLKAKSDASEKKNKQNENVNPEVQKAYGAVYDLTDVHGDEALEVMDEFVEDAGLTDVLEKFLDDIKLTPKESTDLIDVLIDVAGELA